MIYITKKASIERYGKFDYSSRVTFELAFPHKELHNARFHDVCFAPIERVPYVGLANKLIYFPFNGKVYDKKAANRFYKYLLYGKGARLNDLLHLPSVKSIEWEGIPVNLTQFSYPGMLALLTLFRYPVEYPDIVDITLHLVDELKLPFVHAFYLAHHLDHPQRLAENRANGHSFYLTYDAYSDYVMVDIKEFILALNRKLHKMSKSLDKTQFQPILLGAKGARNRFYHTSRLYDLEDIKKTYASVKKHFITDPKLLKF